jgi:hypothetical protein
MWLQSSAISEATDTTISLRSVRKSAISNMANGGFIATSFTSVLSYRGPHLIRARMDDMHTVLTRPQVDDEILFTLRKYIDNCESGSNTATPQKRSRTVVSVRFLHSSQFNRLSNLEEPQVSICCLEPFPLCIPSIPYQHPRCFRSRSYSRRMPKEAFISRTLQSSNRQSQICELSCVPNEVA